MGSLHPSFHIVKCEVVAGSFLWVCDLKTCHSNSHGDWAVVKYIFTVLPCLFGSPECFLVVLLATWILLKSTFFIFSFFL